MMKWAKKTLADVAGTQEPIYGPEAIRTVTEQAKTTPSTELKKEDLKWRTLSDTNVETQTFYFLADSGHVAFCQVIYSSVMGVKTTCQFSSKIFYPGGTTTPPLFATDQLDKVRISDDRHNFYATNVSFELSEDGNTYALKSSRSTKSIMDIKITKTAPGFKCGNDGTSYYGTDPKKPWGKMFHGFWPRCKVEGSFITPSGPLDMKGQGLFISALQGMKPHHAAARWNYLNLQCPTFSAVMMEFTTPPSYGTTSVNVGGVASDGKIIYAGCSNTVKHLETKVDPEPKWPEPTKVEYSFKGTTTDGKPFEAHVMAPLGPRVDRIDVMAEVPQVIKNVIAAAAGTKPYIYQFMPKLKIKIKMGEEEREEEGQAFIEATFITLA